MYFVFVIRPSEETRATSEEDKTAWEWNSRNFRNFMEVPQKYVQIYIFWFRFLCLMAYQPL